MYEIRFYIFRQNYSALHNGRRWLINSSLVTGGENVFQTQPPSSIIMVLLFPFIIDLVSVSLTYIDILS